MPEGPATITPDSKVGELLERWPELESVLVEISPHFRALRNPVLRRTIARVATLKQVSSVSGVSLLVLLEKLRAGAGLPSLALPDEPGAPPAERPPWARPEAVTRSRDVRPAFEAGQHPLREVMADLAALGAAEVYELVTPFVPAPLVDMAREKGFEGHSSVESGELVRTLFRRAPRGAAGQGETP